MGRQGARFARRRSRLHPLTPQLAQTQSSGGFKASEVRPEAVPSHLAKAPHERVQGLLDQGVCLSERTLGRGAHCF